MEKSKGHDPIKVASFLFTLTDRDLTLMQLNKIPYIAHGYCLAIEDEPLSNEEPEAWIYGPVFRKIFSFFKNIKNAIYYNKTHIQNTEYDFSKNKHNFSKTEQMIIKKVFDKYKHKHSFALSDITHLPGTPWHQVWSNRACGSIIISDDIIMNHYKGLLKRGLAHG